MRIPNALSTVAKHMDEGFRERVCNGDGSGACDMQELRIDFLARQSRRLPPPLGRSLWDPTRSLQRLTADR